MALKKHKKEADIEALTEEVKKTSPEEEATENPHINEEEAKVLSEQAKTDEAESKKISTKKMEDVVALVSRVFNLSEDGYVVNAFADKGSKSQISLSNEDFDIVITIKDNEKFGII